MKFLDIQICIQRVSGYNMLRTKRDQQQIMNYPFDLYLEASQRTKHPNGIFTTPSDLPPFNYDDNFVYTKGKQPKKVGIKHIITPQPQQSVNLDDNEDYDLNELQFHHDLSQQLNQISRIIDDDENFQQASETSSICSKFVIENQQDLSKIDFPVFSLNQTNLSVNQQIPIEKQTIKQLSILIKLQSISKVRIKKILFDVRCPIENCKSSQIEMKRNGKTNKFEKSQKDNCIVCENVEIDIDRYAIDKKDKEPVIISYKVFEGLEIYSIEFNKRCCTKDYTTGSENAICYGSSKIATPFCLQCEKTQEISWKQVAGQKQI